MTKTIVVIGGGAAGFFGAITTAKNNTDAKVILLEKTRSLLSKVKISGGGRCNVTHACFDPKELVKNYPRGHKELLGPFHQFHPGHTIQWFEERGVSLKTEDDGRIFPTTDQSETIINCLQQEARTTGVDIRLQQSVVKIEKKETGFKIHFSTDETLSCDNILLATGSSREGYTLAESFGHTIIPPVPSLFTFNVPISPLLELAGISVNPVILKIKGTKLEQEGPLLLTHWGFSGPAALKLSAWGAKILHDMGYQATLLINWLPNYTPDDLKSYFLYLKAQNEIFLHPPTIAQQLWKALLIKSKFPLHKKTQELTNKELFSLAEFLQKDSYIIAGKTTYKQEFVTCGGIALNEVNFKTMESKKCPGLFFAGEILNIDGITGGFNFQSAWTTGFLAGTTLNPQKNSFYF